MKLLIFEQGAPHLHFELALKNHLVQPAFTFAKEEEGSER